MTAGTLSDSQLQDASNLQVRFESNDAKQSSVRRRRKTLGRNRGLRTSDGDGCCVVFMVSLQIKLNISVGEEQVLVNDIPVELSGVTRLTCQALLREFPHNTSLYWMISDREATLVLISVNR